MVLPAPRGCFAHAVARLSSATGRSRSSVSPDLTRGSDHDPDVAHARWAEAGVSVSVIVFRGDEALKSSASSDLSDCPVPARVACSCTRQHVRVAYGHNPALSLAYSHGYSVHAGGLYLRRNRRLQEYSPQSAARAHNTDRHTMHVTGDTDTRQRAGGRVYGKARAACWMANQLVRHRRACAHRAAADARATFWVGEHAHFAREFACGSLALTLTQTSEGGERRRSGGILILG